MKYKIEELKDITDSREILQSTPNGFSKYMMYIIITLLLCVLIWSLLATKEITVRASGTVKPAEEITKITSSINGNITTSNIKDGMQVNEGDILLVVDGEEYELQKKSIEESLEARTNELEGNNKLKKSIVDNVNYFSEDNSLEKPYLDKYNIYLDNMKSENMQVDLAENQIETIKKTNSDLELLLKSINEEKNYFNESHYLYYQYIDYEMTLNNYRKQINSYEEKINELENEKSKIIENEGEEESNNISTDVDTIDKQIKEIRDNIDNINDEINKYKNNQKLSVSNSIAQNQSQITENTAVSNNSNYKEQYISQLDSTISSLESTISELNMNLELINNKIESTSIKAQCSGIINLINDINQGDYIQAGTQIASIIPNENTKFKAEIYIENQNFGEISEGEDVILEFVSLPQNEYGIVRTNLTDISIDAKYSENEGRSFYLAQCDIPVTSMTNKKGTSIDIKNGMIVEARIINREVSYLRYFLEKINILD